MIEPSILEINHSSTAVSVIGIVNDNEKKVSHLVNSITDYSKNIFDSSETPAIIVGNSLKKHYKLEEGAAIKIIFNLNNRIKVVPAIIAGFYSAPMNRIDELFVLMNYSSLGKIIERIDADELVVSLKNIKMNSIDISLSEIIPRKYKLTQWSDLFPDIIKLIELNDAAMFIVGIVIYTLVFISVTNSMLMSFCDKLKNFGMLICYGISQFQLFKLIIIEALIFFIITSIAGTLISFTAILYFGIKGIDLSAFLSDNPYFMMDMRIYTELPGAELLSCYAGLLLASLLAAAITGRKLFKSEVLALLHF